MYNQQPGQFNGGYQQPQMMPPQVQNQNYPSSSLGHHFPQPNPGEHLKKDAKSLPFMPSMDELNQIMKIAEIAVKSRLLPNGIDTVEKAVIIGLKSWELGIPFMTGVSQIAIINGKPTMQAELIQALARKNLPGMIINYLESTDRVCHIEGIRPEPGSQPLKISFTYEQAEKAGLTKKDNWKNYPAAMLRARAVTALLRALCPEALLGISYTPEELGADVNEDGSAKQSIIETTGRTIHEDKSKPAQARTEPKVDSDQIQKLLNIGLSLKYDKDKLENFIMRKFECPNIEDLTVSQYEIAFNGLKEKLAELTKPKDDDKTSNARAGDGKDWETDLQAMPHMIK